MKIISKFRENLGLQDYHLGPVLRPQSFPVFLKKLEGSGLVSVWSGSQSQIHPSNQTLKHYIQEAAGEGSLEKDGEGALDPACDGGGMLVSVLESVWSGFVVEDQVEFVIPA